MLSVVVPIYNEEENIVAFHAAIKTVMGNLPESWEVIYVNDGSRDKSLSLLLDIQRRDPHVSVVEFSRNFGHQAALTAGLQLKISETVVQHHLGLAVVQGLEGDGTGGREARDASIFQLNLGLAVVAGTDLRAFKERSIDHSVIGD